MAMLSCPLCHEPRFDGVDSLRASLVSVATSPLACPVCHEALLGLDKLTVHLLGHVRGLNEEDEKVSSAQHAEESRAQPAGAVEEIDKTIEGLQNSEGEDPVVVVRCDICGFSFGDRNILDMHQKLLHQTSPDKTGSYSYHCHLCSKKFRMRGSLMVHLRVAHYGFGAGHSCKTGCRCKGGSSGDPEKSDGGPQRGLCLAPSAPQGKGQDISNKQWECDVCQKLFTTKYFLKKHKRLHTGEMPYCCSLCNKSFTFQQSYHKHMLYHSSEKPYVCNECGRAFKELSTLQNHSRIHSGERPFGCETCGKSFRQRVSYLVHRRIHTGAMPYRCTACDKSFRYKVSQKSHRCPSNPPGSVVRVPQIEKTSISLDGDTRIEISYNRADLESAIMTSSEATEPKDLFPTILSPIIPEVESLRIVETTPDESLEELLC